MGKTTVWELFLGNQGHFNKGCILGYIFKYCNFLSVTMS